MVFGIIFSKSFLEFEIKKFEMDSEGRLRDEVVEKKKQDPLRERIRDRMRKISCFLPYPSPAGYADHAHKKN